MPLMDHLRELRVRLVKSALALIVAMIVALVFHTRTWEFLTNPYCQAKIQHVSGCNHLGHQLIVNSIFDPLFIQIKIAFYLALIVASPVWLYQLWAFIAPGLYTREKKWAYIFTGVAVPLFVAGAVMAYIVMGRGIYYLLGFSPSSVLPLVTVDSYIGYMFGMVVGFGLAFELPLVLIMLNLSGILTHERFRKWRKVLIFVTFVLAGMVNPSPDPWTMLLLGGLTIILVEIAEVFVYFNDKRRARLHPARYANLPDDQISSIDDEEAGSDPS
jgi:sec-independent protein translocase protein TatC